MEDKIYCNNCSHLLCPGNDIKKASCLVNPESSWYSNYDHVDPWIRNKYNDCEFWSFNEFTLIQHQT